MWIGVQHEIIITIINVKYVYADDIEAEANEISFANACAHVQMRTYVPNVRGCIGLNFRFAYLCITQDICKILLLLLLLLL